MHIGNHLEMIENNKNNMLLIYFTLYISITTSIYFYIFKLE